MLQEIEVVEFKRYGTGDEEVGAVSEEGENSRRKN